MSDIMSPLALGFIGIAVYLAVALPLGMLLGGILRRARERQFGKDRDHE